MPHIRAEIRRAGGTAIAAATLAGLLAAAPAAAEEIYRHVDADGVTSFSDVPVPDAQRLELNAPPPAEGGAARARETIEQQLSVAKALEESRLAREKARAELLQARAAARPRTVVYYPVERTVYGGGYVGGYWRPGHGLRPGKPGHRPERPGYRPPYFHPVHPLVPERPPAPARPDHHRGRQSRAFGTGR